MNIFLKYWNLREMYRAVFHRNDRRPEPVLAILDDLREFCRADTTCIVVGKDGHIDMHATAVAEGRREVYLRIQQTLTLSDETLNKMKDHENE